MRILTTCILLFGVLLARAQAPATTSSPNAWFSVSNAIGCDDYTVTIITTECGGAGCSADWGDGTIRGVDPNFPDTYQHTYTEPGTYVIDLLRGSVHDILTIEVVENIAPSFQVGNCGGRIVSLDVIDTNYDQYIISWGDGKPDDVVTSTINPTHTYDATGDYTISVRGIDDFSADNCASSNSLITVTQSLVPPTISQLDVLDASRIALDFSIGSDVYKLGIATNNASSFQEIRTIYNQSNFTMANVQPENSFYCFRLGVYNPCSGSTTFSNTNNVVCSANFDVEVQDNAITSTWVTDVSSDFDNAAPTSAPATKRLSITDIGTATSTVSGDSYTDTNVQCGRTYCYRYINEYSNGSRSLSLEKCGVAISTAAPDAITDIATVVLDAGVELEWTQPPGFTADIYSIYKGPGRYQRVDTTDQNTYADPSYTAGSGACYKIQYADICGNESESSLEACPLFLEGALITGNNISLSWTAYNGYEDGVSHYVLEKYTMDGTLLQSFDVSGTDTVDNNQNLLIQQYVYIVKAIPNNGSQPISISNTVIIIKEPNLFYPTSFTPNGDNLNDLFNVFGQYITAFEMDIFNRWGEQMFTTDDIDSGWDGTFRGNDMPEGTYTFIARIKDLAGRNFKRSGSVLLLRR